ncbi:MAG: hypothetical protein E7606_02935 [Ruminococcaceae bacterium]|nr:hypothetical protein [Oscillospiraceae bacterium]
MNKKLIAFALCVLALFSVLLTSCGKSEDGEAENSKVTLTMLVVSDAQVYYTDAELAAMSAEERARVEETRAQYDAVTEQINKVTKAKYNTALEIFYYTEEQYYEAVETKMLNTEDKMDAKNTATKAYKALAREQKKLGVTDEVELYHLFGEKYPELLSYIAIPAALVDKSEEEALDEDAYPEVDVDQVDILFVGSYDKYMEYIDAGWLSKLNDQLNSTAKKLTSYVYPAFLEAVKVKKNYYAVPNNTVIGQYTSLLVNKAMCDKYSDPAQITSLATALDLIETVAKYEKDYDPVWCNSYDGVTNVHYWSVDYTETEENGRITREFFIDPTKFSVLGAMYRANYTSLTSDPQIFSFGNLMDDSVYIEQLVALKTIEFEGYRGAENSEKPFAVGVIKGSGEEIAKYEDEYYNIILEYPVATENDLFGSMFAVGNYTSNLTRAMEILTYLNTDSDFRNLFQYGLKDINYELTEDGRATRVEGNLYQMDVYKTGNIFVAYPDADKGMTHQTLENAKKQDLEVVFNPAMGFAIVPEDFPDRANIKTVLKASEEFLAKIEACESVDELRAVIADCNAEIQGGIYKEAIRQKAMYSTMVGDQDFSAYALYMKWAKAMGYLEEQ